MGEGFSILTQEEQERFERMSPFRQELFRRQFLAEPPIPRWRLSLLRLLDCLMAALLPQKRRRHRSTCDRETRPAPPPPPCWCSDTSVQGKR